MHAKDLSITITAIYYFIMLVVIGYSDIRDCQQVFPMLYDIIK